MATKRRIEKRGDKHYLYEVTPYWDSEKKQGRHRKVYIGPCDAEGNLQGERKRSEKEILVIDCRTDRSPSDRITSFTNCPKG